MCGATHTRRSDAATSGYDGDAMWPADHPTELASHSIDRVENVARVPTARLHVATPAQRTCASRCVRTQRGSACISPALPPSASEARDAPRGPGCDGNSFPVSASGSKVPGDLRSACAARRAVTGRSVRPQLPRRAPAARACGSAVPPSAAPLTATCAPAPGARYASTHQLRTAARVLLGLHELRYTARPSRRPRRAHDVLLRRDARRQHGGRVGVSLVTQAGPRNGLAGTPCAPVARNGRRAD